MALNSHQCDTPFIINVFSLFPQKPFNKVHVYGPFSKVWLAKYNMLFNGKVLEGNDQEMGQSETKSHSKTEGWEKLN